MKKILTFFFTLFALLAGAQTVVITQTGTGSGIDTSYQIGDSIYIVAGGTDTIFTGVAVSGGGGGSGTVTSVAATVPTGFSVTGSPITTSGTLAITNNLAAGVVKSSGVGLSFTSGLVDIITETTGTLTPARGGTGLTALGTANQLLRINSGGTALEYFTPSFPTGTGTTNYLVKWLGASAQGNSLIFDNGTNVGIGTNSPVVSQTGTGLHFYSGTQNAGIRIGSDFTNGKWSYIEYANAANVVSYIQGVRGSDMTYRLIAGTGLGAATGLILNSSGNIGIGTATPVSKIDVEGGISIGANYSGTTAAPTNGAIIEGNVGIGTTSPNISGFGGSYKVLTIRGSSTSAGVVELSSSTSEILAAQGLGQFSFLNASTVIGRIQSVTEGTMGNSGALAFKVKNAGTEIEGIRITGPGNVGLGTTLPSVKLEVEETGTGNVDIVLFDRFSSPSTGNYTQFGIGLSNVYTTGIRSWNEGGSNFSTSIHTLISGISNTVPAMYFTHQNKVGINQDTASYWLDIKGNKASTRLYSTSASAEIVLQNTTTGYVTDAGGTISQSGNDMEISTTASISLFSETTPSKVTSIDSQGVFKSATFTGAEAVAITAADGMFIYVTSTSGVFTAVGFWGRENGTWIKL